MFIPLLHSSLVLFILGGLGSWEFSGGPGHVFFLRGASLCGMSIRYNLFERQPGVGGGTVHDFSPPVSVVVGTVRLK